MVSSVGSGSLTVEVVMAVSVQSRASCSGILVNSDFTSKDTCCKSVVVRYLCCLDSVNKVLSRLQFVSRLVSQGLQYSSQVFGQLICWRPTERDYRSHRYVWFV